MADASLTNAPSTLRMTTGRGGGGGLHKPAKRRRPGYGGRDQYADVSPDSYLVQSKTVSPSSGGNGDQASVTFTVTVGANEMISFSDNPFTVEFEIKYTNTNFGVGGQPNNDVRELWATPHLLLPPMYVDQRMGGQFLYSSIDVTMDGIKMEGPNLVNQASQYQTINRTFCSDETRRAKYGTPLKWMSNSTQRAYQTSAIAVEAREARELIADVWAAREARAYVPATKQSIHPLLADAMDGTYFSADGVDGHSTRMALGFDGYFPISTQCNALLEITGQKNENQYLRPGSEIVFQLMRRTPNLYSAIERANVDDQRFYGFAAINVATPPFKIYIRSITLTYESVILQNKDYLVKLSTKSYRYLCDVPFLRENKLSHGGFHDNVKVPLPKGTKFVFLYFCFEGQILPNSREASFVSNRFRFAPNLDELRLHLLGRENLVVARGLKHLGNADGRHSESLRSFHAQLVRQKLYTKSFDEWFPRWVNNHIGYDQVLPIDLTWMAKDLRESVTSLEVDLTYKEEAAREHWVLRSLSLVERVYEYSTKTSWTWKDL
jgi:hypothetical protein